MTAQHSTRTSVSHTYLVEAAAPVDAGLHELLASVITEAGATLADVPAPDRKDVAFALQLAYRARDLDHGTAVHGALTAAHADIVVTDVIAERHRGGKLSIAGHGEVSDLTELAFIYTPGVARPCLAIAEDPERAYDLTIKGNSVAVISDGSAVLGLGDIGPLAAMPVMEGKAILLRDLAGVDAYPICLDERDPDRLVDMIVALSTGFGGINLEDIAAPRCFEIEGKLRQRLQIPVFHDDQHGTAVVVLAAMMNAAAVVDKPLGSLRVVVQGVGAAGIAVANLLMAAGVSDVVGVDRDGIVTTRRKDSRDPIFRRFGKQTNPRRLTGGINEAMTGADVFVGLSAGNTITPAHLALMAEDPIVFAMANPVPEIDPRVAAEHAAVVATGRSDFPNQINNVLCFPGLFRGLLDARARTVDDPVKLAAAAAIAGIVSVQDRGPERIIPSPLDRRVAPAVAAAVRAAVMGAAEDAGDQELCMTADQGADDLRQRITRDVRALVAVDARERTSQAVILQGLAKLERPFDTDANRTHVTGSAIVAGPRGIVLLRHKRLGIWVQPGGHIDPGEHPAEAALREAVEETGLSRLVHHGGRPRLIHVDVHAGGRGHRHLDLRYLLTGDDADPAPGPEESQECDWFGWQQARVLADPGLRGAIPRVEAIVTGT